MSKRNKVLVGAGVGVLLILLVVVSASANHDSGVEVRFEKVGRRDLVAAVTASGKIQPKKKGDITSDIQGRMTRIAVKEGDFVHKGDFLTQTARTIYAATLDQEQGRCPWGQSDATQPTATRGQAQPALLSPKDPKR